MFTVIVDAHFAASSRAWLADTDYRLATSYAQVWDYVAPAIKNGTDLAIDFEATGLNVWTDKIVGTSISCAKGSGIYIPHCHFEGAEYNLPIPPMLEILAEIDRAPLTHWWFHADYDHEIAWNDWHWRPTFGKWRDAMIAVFLEYSDAANHGLKDSAQRLLQIEMISYEEVLNIKKRKGAPLPGFQVVHPLQAPPYAIADADMTGRLARLADVQKAIKDQSFIWNLEHKILQPVRKGINAGVPADGIYWSFLHANVLKELEQLGTEIKGLLQVPASFNLRARGQLGERLVEIGVPISERTPGRGGQPGQVSTRKTVLAKYKKAFPIIEQLTRFAELSAADRGYILKGVAATAQFGNRIRIQFNTTGAPTGRMSSGGAGRTQASAFAKGYANLNGQSWPDPEKQPYLPDVRAGVSTAGLDAGDDWVIVAADFEQVELRVVANVSGEKLWQEMFAQGIDILAGNGALIEHGLTGRVIPVDQVTPALRKKGKIATYAIVYQATAKTVAAQAGILEDEAQTIIDTFLGTCTALKTWIQNTKDHAECHGYVKTPFGRQRKLRGYFSEDRAYKTPAAKKLRNRGHREGVNHPIQGGAADVFKIAIYLVDQAIARFGAEADWIPIQWVHDEMVSLVRRSRLYELLPEIRRAMEFDVKGWNTPLKVSMEVGWNWGVGMKPKDPKDIQPTPFGRNWGCGLLPWDVWCQRYPPGTATTPLVCWLPAGHYLVPDVEPVDDDADEEILDLSEWLGGSDDAPGVGV